MNHENTRKLMMEERKSCKGRGDENAKAKETRVTPPQKPHYGLYNQGATCYLNSVLQVLFMTTEIHHRLDPQTNQELRKIFTDLKTKTCGTEKITKCLEIQNVYELHDAAECLQKILHHISPQASEVFRGQLMDTTKCSKGHIINNETKPFWILPLSLKDTPYTTYSVQSSFERTFQIKTYSGDNMKYCNDCRKKTEATSECEMVEAPHILILLLKRFHFDYNTKSHFKSHCCVEVPCELQMKNKTYKVYGMVNHMGSRRDGRYTATVLSEDNTWYECNDAHVSKIKCQLFAEDRTFSSRTVYLLTYRAIELEMSCEMRLNEEDEVEMRSDDEVLNHQIEGEEDNTDENSKSEELNDAQKQVYCDKKTNATSSSAKKVITEHKVELIDCLMADHSLILQHAHAKQIIRDNQYLNIKKKSPSTPQETVIDLIDEVIFNGQESCTRFLEVLKLSDVRSTYPQLKEIINKMLCSNSGSNA